MRWLICGSGPTLSDANFDELPKNRIAVNFAITVVPDCYLVSCIDDCYFYPECDEIHEGKLRIVTPFTLEVARNRGTVIGDHVVVDIRGGGSTGAAVVYAIDNGATEIIFYGIGGNGHAKELDWYKDNAPEELSQELNYSLQRANWTEYAESRGVKLDIR